SFWRNVRLLLRGRRPAGIALIVVPIWCGAESKGVSGPRWGAPGTAQWWLLLDELVEQFHGGLPRGVAGGEFALADPVEDRAEHVVLDDRVLGTLDLGDDALRAVGEDLTDRCVVEERVDRALHEVLSLERARERTGCLERRGLLLGGSE